MGEALELTVAILDLGIGKFYQSVEAEILDVERGHYTSENDGPTEILGAKIPGIHQIAHEPAGEGVPRPGGVVDRLEGIAGGGKNLVPFEHQYPVFTRLGCVPGLR